MKTTNQAKMYRVWMVNFGYYIDEEFESFDAAMKRAKGTSFECRIDCNDEMVASWGYFSGLRVYNKALAV